MRLVEDVPAESTGRVAYDATDNFGQPLAVLDPVADPDGGYLGVYDFASGGSTLPYFDVAIAHSPDLIHWTRLAILDTAANSPSLRQVPGAVGYLLAEEKYSALDPFDHLRVRYYRTLADVVAGSSAAEVDLPRRYSPYSNGTPNFMAIAWNGGLARSVVRLGFHYLPAASGPAHQGPDREALGTLRGFHDWTTRRDRRVDELLDRVGITGKHGDRRQFTFGGQLWRTYEGQTSYALDGFANWRVVLYDLATGRMLPLKIRTSTGRYAVSFGAPIIAVEPGPGRAGPVLVVTMFVYTAGPGEGGELIYYQPLIG